VSGHLCHAHGCKIEIAPRLLMCPRHWFALPGKLRAAIWREYRPGQERDKGPSLRYMAVQRRAIGTLVFRPHDEEAARLAAPYLLEAEAFRQAAIEAGQGDPLEGLSS
jgi:hypothetical protein